MPARPGQVPSNAELAEVIQMIADYLALDGQSTYRIIAYEKAAALFRDYPVSIADMALQGGLRQLPGVGDAIESKVLEYLATGDIAFLARLRERYPEGLLLVMRLQGLGPKKTRFIWENTGVGDIRGLERAAREGRLRGLPGMGEKTETNILRAIETWTATVAGKERGRRLRAVVEPQAVRLVDVLLAVPGVVAANFAGSLRRCRATVRDIDLVVASSAPEAVMAAFAALPELARVEAQGATKLAAAAYTGVGVDLRVVPPASYGNLLQHFTGSADHNVGVGGKEKRRG
jgi:DNA polymerase (family X)